MKSDPRRVTFLFVRGLHHFVHSIPAAVALSMRRPDLRVTTLVSEGAVEQALNTYLARFPDHRCEVVVLRPSAATRPFVFGSRRDYPAPLYSYLRSYGILRESALIISTSMDSPKILRRIGLGSIPVAYWAHGVGDGSYGFQPSLHAFDVVFVGGESNRERMIRETGLAPAKVEVVGYGKFETCAVLRSHRTIAFPSERPIAWYAPHWNGALSSLRPFGAHVVRWFAERSSHNLVFAPHMLARLRYRENGYSADVADYGTAENVLHDWASPALCDLSYAHAADLYIGDVSSQVYEFVHIRPRPCVFLNADPRADRASESFRHYDLGVVCTDPRALGDAIAEAYAREDLQELQKARAREYFSDTGVPPSERAAEAIERFLRG